MPVADKLTAMSAQVLEPVQRGQQAAREAVCTFAKNVNQTRAPSGEGRSERQELLDAAWLVGRLVRMQYDFLRTAGRTVSEALGARSPERGQQ